MGMVPRRIDRILELSIVRKLIAGCCNSEIGRPSIDPEVFFPARSPLGSSRVEPEKLRIESGQQLFDVRDLADRGLFAGRGQFLRAHEF